MTGLDRMLYMQATSDSSGSAQLDADLRAGHRPGPRLGEGAEQAAARHADAARSGAAPGAEGQQVDPQLPDDRRPHHLGPALEAATTWATTWSSRVENVLARVPGVGEVEVFGTGYSMRIWLDPDKLTKYGMTIDDVVAAVRAYNVEVSAGQFGGAPAVPGQRLNASILVQSLLKTPEEFAAVPLRTNADGSVVRVSDVGRTELGTELDRHPGQLQRAARDGAGHPPGSRRQRPRHGRRRSRRRWPTSRSTSRRG